MEAVMTEADLFVRLLTSSAPRWVAATRGVMAASVILMGSGCVAPKITADPVYYPSAPAVAHAVHIKSFNRLDELIPLRPTLADVLRGQSISPEVAKPAGIAHVAGHLYICDTDMNAIHDWDLATGAARQLGTDGDARLSKPVAVAVDGDGNPYVADTGRSEVVAFGDDGRVRFRLRPPERKTYRPTALAIRGSVLQVTDIASHKVDAFATEDGRHLGSFGEVGSALGQFYFPMGLAADATGRLLLSDMMNGRVQVFDGENHAVLSMGQPGDRYGDMGKPRQLAVGPDGVIFVADPEFGRVHLFDNQGRLLMLLGGDGEQIGSTPMPVGVAVATDLPESISSLVPADFRADYYLFVCNTVGVRRISLFAIGRQVGGEARDDE
jgi:sugar lactone lactonase YvrE